jgi:dolichol-phosphate mannosyltransferase
VPITFTEREIGTSKMSGSIMTEAFTSIARWGFAWRWQQITGRGRRRS